MTPKPTISGVAGRAWRVELAEETRRVKPAGLGLWLVHAPSSHPIWPWKLVACVSLADLPGVAPAVRARPELTHEFLVYAVNPEEVPRPLERLESMARGEPVPYLRPFETVHQVQLRHDVDATRILHDLVRAFVAGILIPDQDYRSAINAALDMTAAHYRSGAHGDPS